ncbi:FAD-dependent monooxygenase [Corynebacterium glutamicum]|uniref:FAD-dependent monooxygenase n=1 Tax=Corynebacterium glutamicum TaxID=1718 RepID=UPI0011B81BD8|nr:FAD-dependent monooxygenase [Corynebacterium glutamicum]TWS37788.1 phenol 2-monooxygenase [Corynebacterium glutamicum]TWS43522.1 phenol 2-monooxygenase [Corynebacterium glutamicum]TWS48018.1 phenol 2-monooxygenase [Corynebacterium glutamicum]TWS50905.1 phenol 2-monooxygenase [Corynebacterium glutamicum]
MQFHHYGYVSEEPKRLPAAGIGLNRPDELPDEMDVLIVGTGPAGMITAAQLSMFPDVHTRIIEKRDRRLELGQADGIQARSVETFQAFGFAKEITDEAFHLTEMAFWNQDPQNPENIVRGARPLDDEFGISEFPHLIVNQARVLDYFSRYMKQSPTRMAPDFGWEFVSLTVSDDPADAEYPVTATLKRVVEGEPETTRTVRAKYVVGSDGARSRVRESIGRTLAGDQANHAWSVMDIVADTDFPDIRTKCAIHSKAGSILHIPREGGYLFRMYVDLGEVPADDNHRVRQTPLETVIAKANEIIAPYYVDVKYVAWHSIYEVGHRLVDGFDDLNEGDAEDACPRVFLTGDACHTHSAKAGQGMNVSMQDGFNIGWKLGHVLSGRAPESLLRTYHDERHPAAANLIAFDKEWSTLMATPADQLEDPEAVEKYYVAAEEFAAGFLTEYKDNLITAGTEHQALASGFPVGRRFKSEIALRRCDAVTTHIGHEHSADGRWRIYAFADQATPQDSDSTLNKWAQWMEESEDSPLNRFTPEDGDRNAIFDIKAIYQQHYHSFDLFDAPEVFFPRVGPYKLQNLENVWTALDSQDIFESRGISRDGAIVVVRPDQYVAAVLPLEDTAALTEFFNGNLLEP